MGSFGNNHGFSRMRFRAVAAVVVAVLLSGAVQAATWYVSDSSGDDANEGHAWSTAKKTIQKAIDSAASGDEIIVTNGVYNRISSESASKILTLRSVEGAAKTMIWGRGGRCVLSATRGTLSDIGYSTATPHHALRLDGFTITNGYVSSDQTYRLGGAGALGGFFKNCVFIGNGASGYYAGAGAAYSLLVDSLVVSNTASYYGGGLYSCTATNVTLIGNQGDSGGGAMSSVLVKCRMSDNIAGFGAAVSGCTVDRCVICRHNNSSVCDRSTIHDSLIYSNVRAEGNDGGYVFDESDLLRCTVVGNDARKAGGIFSYRGSFTDCVLYENMYSYDLEVRWTEFKNCYFDDPKFVDAANCNYHLRKDSPCIDKAGACTAEYDLDGQNRIYNSIADLGAYEWSPVAEIKNVTATPRYPWSGKVDVDFTLEGDADEKYVVELSAKDMVGGTNLPVRTVMVGRAVLSAPQSQQNAISLDDDCGGVGHTALTPGTYRLTWDADADIAADADFPRVTMTARATLQQRYSVRFNANGGSGTLADQAFVADETKPLFPNAFTRTGYAFSGWATNATGEVVYADKAEVKNLTTKHRGVVELFAAWREIPLYMVVNLSAGPDAASYGISYLSEAPSGGWADTYKTSLLVLRRVDPGTYVMQEEITPYADPTEARMSPRTVTVEKPFYIGVFEVTQKQYYNVYGGYYPSFFQNTTYASTRPVESINWKNIRGAVADYPWPQNTDVLPTSFMGKLRAKTGKAFDLPLESQWEWACRAGTKTPYYGSTVAKVARYWLNGGSSIGKPPYSGGGAQGNWEGIAKGTATVGSYTPNAWGLYDMLGNVKEWVLNDQSGLTVPTSTDRVARGGSWQSGEYGCTCISRYDSSSTKEVGAYGTAYNTAGIDEGFRVCCPAE